MDPFLLHRLHHEATQARRRADRLVELAATVRDPPVAAALRELAGAELERVGTLHLFSLALGDRALQGRRPTMAERFRAAWLGFWRG